MCEITKAGMDMHISDGVAGYSCLLCLKPCTNHIFIFYISDAEYLFRESIPMDNV